MTNELQEIKELFEQIEQRIKQLKEKCKEEDDKWPRNGDKFYSIDWPGEVIEVEWNGFNCSERMGEQLSEIGNVFKTREEAEFVAEKLKVIQELKRLARPFKMGLENYSIELDCSEMEFYVLVSYEWRDRYGDFYFDTKAEGQQAIQKIGADRIKKYLFGVCE